MDEVSKSLYRLVTTLAAALVVAACLYGLTYSWYKSRSRYNAGVQTGSLSADTKFGYPSASRTQTALISSIRNLLAGDPEQFEGHATILGEAAGTPQNKVDIEAPSILHELLKMRRGYFRLLENRGAPTIWTLAPILVYNDDEGALLAAAQNFAAANPDQLVVTVTKGEKNEPETDPPGRKDLDKFLSFYDRLMAPKVYRLIAARRFVDARRLTRTATGFLQLFTIDNDALTEDELSDISRIYLMSVLISAPGASLENAVGIEKAASELTQLSTETPQDEIAIISSASDSNDEDTSSDDTDDDSEQRLYGVNDGPPIFRELVSITRSIGTDALPSTPVLNRRSADLTVEQDDLSRLLITRHAFWAAWSACVDKKNATCSAKRAALLALANQNLQKIQNANFKRDITAYKAKVAKW